ncbi:MAG TPA: hypothetical protein VH475_09330, partial [Tepidisphaeraceae bacterium]
MKSKGKGQKAKVGSGGAGVLRAYSVLVYAFLYAPIAVLIIYSFNTSVQTAKWLGFTPRWYAQ